MESKFKPQQQLDILKDLDIGLIVINTDLEIQLWNNFIINHTAIESQDALNKPLFDICPDIDADFLSRKVRSVIALQNSLTITWQQRPYLIKMDSYRPITSHAQFMYQNIRIMPLMNANAEVDHVAIVLYDVTDAARAQLAFKEKNIELTYASQIDPLTKLNNRGHWETRLEEEFKRFSRSHSPSVLIMLDIDHFKKVNDTYGHQGGDAVLRRLGKILISQYRDTDIIGRYGGEEFGILLLDTDTQKALALVENLTQEILNTDIVHDKKKITITLSFGITQINSSFKRHDEWIDLADKALYQSKQNGRNRATVLNHKE
jgi:diguanylate cyclase (GGDEF)-like protein